LSFHSPDSTIKDFLKGTVPLNQRENSWKSAMSLIGVRRADLASSAALRQRERRW